MKLYERLIKILPSRKEQLDKLLPEGKAEGLTLGLLESEAPEILEEFLEAVQDPVAEGEGQGDGEGDGTAGAGEGAGTEGGGTLEGCGGPKKKKEAGKKKGIQEGVLDDGLGDQVRAALKALDTQFLESALKESGLPEDFQVDIRERFADCETLDREALGKAISGTKSRLAKLTRAQAAPTPVYLEGVEEGAAGEKLRQAMADALNDAPNAPGIREIYVMATGDSMLRGRHHIADVVAGRARGGVLESVNWDDVPEMQKYLAKKPGIMEAVTWAGFSVLMADVLHQEMVREYRHSDLTQHLLISKQTEVPDFQIHRRARYGEYADLSELGSAGGTEAQTYAAFTASPSDEEVTFQLRKFGDLETLTWEATVNDNLGALRGSPARIGRAARRTEYKAGMLYMLNGTNIYTTGLLGTAGQGNLQSTLSEAEFWAARQGMAVMTDIDDVHPISLRPRYLYHGPALTELAEILTMSATRPGPYQPATGFDGTGSQASSTSQNVPGVGPTEVNPIQRRSIVPIEVPYWGDGTNDDHACLVCDPADCQPQEIIYLRGHREPELWVQDLPNVGSFFTDDIITMKIRHLFDVDVLDYRAYQVLT